MSKVILTKEQADAIYFAEEYFQWTFEYFMKNHPNFKCGITESLNDLTLGDLKSALLDGYTTKRPKIIEKSKIVRINGLGFHDGSKIQEVEKVCFSNLYGHTLMLKNGYRIFPSEVREATKEEIFWAELGRDIGRFKDGDLLIDKENHVWSVDTTNSTGISSREMYFDGKLKGFYLPESFKAFPTGDES